MKKTLAGFRTNVHHLPAESLLVAGRNVGSPLLPNLLLVKERRFFGKESSPLEAIRELG